MRTKYNATHKLAIRNGGKLYIRSSRWGWGDSNYNYSCNGDPVVPSMGNNRWAIIDAEHACSLVHLKAQGALHVGWKLKEQFVGKVSMPDELPPDADVECDSDDCPVFYVRVTETQDPIEEPVTLDIIESDHEPREFPDDVRSLFPYDVEYPSVLKWAYPCGMTSEQVCERLLPYLHSKASEQDNMHSVYYESLQSLSVDERVRLHKPYISRPADRRRKGRMVYVKTVRVLDVSKDGRYGARVPSLTGKNLDDLMSKLDALRAEYEAAISVPQHCECPHCGGSGIAKVEVPS